MRRLEPNQGDSLITISNVLSVISCQARVNNNFLLRAEVLLSQQLSKLAPAEVSFSCTLNKLKILEVKNLNCSSTSGVPPSPGVVSSVWHLKPRHMMCLKTNQGILYIRDCGFGDRDVGRDLDPLHIRVFYRHNVPSLSRR